MSQAETLLKSLSVTSTSSEQDNTFVIDSDLRVINIPSGIRNLGVESDDEVMRVKFKMPGIYCGIDLSTFVIRINYLNAKAESDIYEVTDAHKSGDYIVFTWLVGRHAAQYKGNVSFIVCLKDIDSSGNVLREFNTTIATLPILEGLEVNPKVVSKYTDLIEQWRAQLFGIGDTEEANMLAVSEAQQAALENKGAEVLATIPEDYTETYNLAHEATRTKADAITCSAQGEAITVSDSSDDHLRGLKVFGKTTQVTTTGKNLLNVEENFSLTNVKGIPVSLSAGSYIVSITNETHAGDQQPYLRFYNNNVWIQLKNGLAQTAVLSTDETLVYIYTYGMSASESVGVSASFNQLMVSTTGGDYEPYSGGVVSPSPEWPQDTISIESPTVYISGKNLFNMSGIPTKNTISHTNEGYVSVSTYYNPTGIILRDLAPSLVAGTKYRLLLDTDGAPLIWFNTCARGWYHNNVIEMTEEILNSHVTIYGVVDQTNGSTIIRNIQVVLDGASTDYETYKGTQSIEAVYTLSGIPVESEGNYTDSDGQQWICDEVDFERGIYVRRVNTIVCDGTETVTREERYGGTYRFNIMPAVLVRANPYPGGYFSHFAYDIENPIGNNEVDRMFCMWTNGRIYGRYDDMASAEELSAWLTSQYENGTPLTAKYVLETPIETPLTQDEIAAFKALYSNYPNTTVLNDSGATMELRYNADTKIYFNNLPKATDEQVWAAVDAWLTAKYGAIAEEASF